METPPAHKVLSFCIPTYGQPHHVRRTLESLLDQDMNEVEIVIRDDNRDSETEKIVCEYLTRLPIRYFKMSNEGVDRAFLFLSKEAKGAFVWWFGDDILESGAMARIMNVLKRDPAIDFMYINSTDLSGMHYSVQLGESRYFVDRNEAISELKDQLGFCSAMLFKRKMLALGLDEAEGCVGTLWVTFFLALHTLASGKSFYFLDGRNFLSEPKPAGEARWYDSFLVHGVNFALVARQFDGRFSRDVLRKMLAEKFFRSWRAVIIERALGHKAGFAAADQKFAVLFKLYWSYPGFYIAFPLMLIPSTFLAKGHRIYRNLLSLWRFYFSFRQ